MDKVYVKQKENGNWHVLLYYPFEDHDKGKVRTNWSRGWWDDDFQLYSENMARKVCSDINAAMTDCKNNEEPFDPTAWFDKKKTRRLLWGPFWRFWLKERQKEDTPGRTIKPRTARGYNAVLKQTNKGWQKKALKDFRRKDIDHMLSECSDPPLLHTVLKALFRWAREMEYIRERPGFPPRPKPKKKRRKGIMPYATQDVVMEHLHHPYDKNIFVLMQSYGDRVSEATALAWECIDFKRKTIIFDRTDTADGVELQRKAGDTNELPLTEEVEAMLRGLPRSLNPTDRVFIKTNNRKTYTRQYLAREWEKACKKAGVDFVPLHHTFRHGKATDLLEKGWTVDDTARWLGHKNVQTTRGYEHRSVEYMRGKL